MIQVFYSGLFGPVSRFFVSMERAIQWARMAGVERSCQFRAVGPHNGAPGLLTGAEPTQEEYDACLVDNDAHADIVIEKRALSKAAWMTRQFFRSTDGIHWVPVTNW